MGLTKPYAFTVTPTLLFYYENRRCNEMGPRGSVSSSYKVEVNYQLEATKDVSKSNVDVQGRDLIGFISLT